MAPGIIALIVLSLPPLQANESQGSTALLLIDIQNFYFPRGRMELVKPEEASLNARKLLLRFRSEQRPIVHIRHNFEPGGEIHANVKPLAGEKIISKDHANAFKDTDLLEYLRLLKIKKVVICGMMTHMCVEAAVRAASDFDFEVVLVHDACATRDLMFQNETISADCVHKATLSSLSRSYAQVTDTATYLKEK